MKTSGIAVSFVAGVVVCLSGATVAVAYPNQYEGLAVGGCASWDKANNTAGPVDCGSVAAEYRLIEQYQLTPETQEQECGPKATFRYHHRTDDGFRLALYCFTYNMTVGSCWDLTDVNKPHRLDCAAGHPNSERLTEVFDGVADGDRCSTTAIVYPRIELTVCVVPN